MTDEPDPEMRVRAACTAQAWDDAAALALAAYGDELMGYLVALLRNAADADDVFASVCEGMWRSLPVFRWESTFRTYLYTLARHAYLKHVRDPRNRRRPEPLSSPSVEAVLAKVRSHTETFLKTEMRDKVAQLRAELDPEDQTLLILRINRQLPWRDIARIMSEDGEATDAAALDKRTVALRKRFERLKVELREKASR